MAAAAAATAAAVPPASNDNDNDKKKQDGPLADAFSLEMMVTRELSRILEVLSDASPSKQADIFGRLSRIGTDWKRTFYTPNFKASDEKDPKPKEKETTPSTPASGAVGLDPLPTRATVYAMGEKWIRDGIKSFEPVYFDDLREYASDRFGVPVRGPDADGWLVLLNELYSSFFEPDGALRRYRFSLDWNGDAKDGAESASFETTEEGVHLGSWYVLPPGRRGVWFDEAGKKRNYFPFNRNSRLDPDRPIVMAVFSPPGCEPCVAWRASKEAAEAWLLKMARVFYE